MRSLLLLSICAFALSHKLNYNRVPEVLLSDSHSTYIIKFKDSPSVARASSFVKAQAAQVSPITLASISSAQGIKLEQHTYGISSTYNSTFLNAMTVILSEEDLSKLEKKYKSKIEYIEPDLKMRIFGTQQKAPWGLARVGQWDRSSSKNYEYPDAAGEGVDVYVIDTGLTATHPSFEGRAKFAKNCVGGSQDNDFVGHGTHVAGTIGSSKYGVAKKAKIYGVKVITDDGLGANSITVDALHYVTERIRPGKTVINMSLGGPKSKAVDDAVAAARKAGALIVAAAGNDNKDACNLSPGGSPHVINVGATDKNDNIANFPKWGSNWGKCVSIFAPGVDIISLGPKGKDDTRFDNGTSMAAPHVTGIAAVYMSIKSYENPDDVVKDILAKSHKCVKGDTKGSGKGIAYVNAKLK